MENQEPSAESTQSFGSRLLNVYAAPSEAFDGITAAPSKTKFWIMPWLAMIVLGIISIFIIFSNPVLKSQIEDTQTRAMQQRVEKGEMTQEQADQAQEAMSSMGGLMPIFGAIGITLVMTGYFFVGALIFWLVGKFALKSTEGYGTYLALYGTSAWIAVLGSLVTLLMILGLGSLYASPSAALAVLSDYDTLNSVHRILTRLDIFAGWQAFVIGVGLTKITGKPTSTTLIYAMGLWIVWAVGTGLLGVGS
jgi:hypothetical protein